MIYNDTLTFRSFVKITIIGIISLLVLTYLVFQARYLIIGPQITVRDIPDLVQNDRVVYLSGSAYNISRLWLNDRPIYTDAQGNFKEALVLENGYTIATLKAEDRYGRKTTVNQEFIYTPSSFY